MAAGGRDCDGVQRLGRAGERLCRYVCGPQPSNEESTMDSTRNPGGRRSAARIALACGLAAVLSCAWLSASADTEVYKWIDAQGRIHYTDRPPPADGRLLSMEAAPGSHRAAASAAAPAPAARSSTPAAAAPSETATDKQRETVANDVANAHAEQCKAATERYNNYIRAHHLYREGPNQERIYLTEAELETERLNAKREFDEACAQQQ
jgi:hypothetical protein